MSAVPIRPTAIYPVSVEFGDCDPAGIVFFPNFLRWMDAATHHFFRHRGVPPWHSIDALPHCVGGALLEIHTRFRKSATYGEQIAVHTGIAEWQRKTFVVQHRVLRGEELLCEGRETRALCVRPPGAPLKAMEIPDWLRQMCS